MDRRLQPIVTLFKKHGDSQYGGEAVTQIEHALQSALLAEQINSGPHLIAAALLHDVGHLLHALPDDAPEQGIDDRHEQLAARYLARFFTKETVDPIRLHVASKRYLCTVEPEYVKALSEPSFTSFKLQGGMMSDAERSAFESEPSYLDAVQLRRWDDTAKVAGLATPPIEHYLPALESSLLAEGAK